MSGVKGKFFWKIFTVLARSPSLCLAHKHTHCTNTTSTHSRCVWLARPAPKDSFVDWFGLGASWKEDLSSRESSPAQQCCALCYCLVLSRVAIFSNNNSFFFSACCCCCRGCHNPSNETKGGRRHLLCVCVFFFVFDFLIKCFFSFFFCYYSLFDIYWLLLLKVRVVWSFFFSCVYLIEWKLCDFTALQSPTRGSNRGKLPYRDRIWYCCWLLPPTVTEERRSVEKGQEIVCERDFDCVAGARD